jgi:putative endonuclease
VRNPDDAGQVDHSPHGIGQIGERLARAHLEARGYNIVAANYRCRWGEIDLIACDGFTWVFVEVRTRRSQNYGSPEESITPRKAQRLQLAAQHYLTQREVAHQVEPDWRIDLIAIRLAAGRRVVSIQHLENAVEV